MAAENADVVARHRRIARVAFGAWAVLVYAFLFVPIVLLVLFSFNANRYGTFPITGWTLHWYEQALSSYQIQDAVQTSIQVALEVTAISTIVGTAAAFPLVRSRLPFRSGIRASLILPILIPGLLIGVALLSFLSIVFSLQLSIQTAVIGQAVYATPFVILVVASRLEGFDRMLERAASDLGANMWRRLRHIVLPLIGPAVLAGALFAFTLSLDEFIITLFLIGNHNTLPIYIYTQVKFGITPEVNAVATMLIAASLSFSLLAFATPTLIRAIRRRITRTSAGRAPGAPDLGTAS